jgi:hypothetical protein
MVPSYETTSWKVGVKSNGSVRIRVNVEGELRDYWIPPDPANADYGMYQEWVATGNRPDILPD